MKIRTARAYTRTAMAFALTCALSVGAGSAFAINAPGLKAPGSISYDAEGVPTVIGATDEDSAWLMGYAHARDRFFQMDLLRRSASGTLAELVGAPALAQDVEIRRADLEDVFLGVMAAATGGRGA